MDATLPRVGGRAKRSSRPLNPDTHAELDVLPHIRSDARQPARFAARLGPLVLAFALALGLVRGAGAARTPAQGAAVPAPAPDSTAPRAAVPDTGAGVRRPAFLRPDSALARPDSGLARPDTGLARPDTGLARPDTA